MQTPEDRRLWAELHKTPEQRENSQRSHNFTTHTWDYDEVNPGKNVRCLECGFTMKQLGFRAELDERYPDGWRKTCEELRGKIIIMEEKHGTEESRANSRLPGRPAKVGT
jgi:hypothetical protein